jgi:hypothetical protein
MLTSRSIKIDKFIVVFAIVLIIMAGIVIYNFRGIFSAMTTAYEVDVNVSASELRIDKGKLDQAHETAFSREVVPLEVR